MSHDEIRRLDALSSSGTISVRNRRKTAGSRRKEIWYSSDDTDTQFFNCSVTEAIWK